MATSERVLKILVLEDDENRHTLFHKMHTDHGHEVTLCPTAAHCKDSLAEEDEFDIFFIDHDLGGQQWVPSENEDTGAGVCRWLVDNRKSCAKIKLAVAHTLNPPGGRNIAETLDSMDLTCYEIGFDKLLKDLPAYLELFEQSLDM